MLLFIYRSFFSSFFYLHEWGKTILKKMDKWTSIKGFDVFMNVSFVSQMHDLPARFHLREFYHLEFQKQAHRTNFSPKLLTSFRNRVLNFINASWCIICSSYSLWYLNIKIRIQFPWCTNGKWIIYLIILCKEI